MPVSHAQPVPRAGVELRWPASAIWRSDEPAVRNIGLSDLTDALRKGIDDFRAMPSHALFLVIVYPIIGLLLARVIFGYGAVHLAFPLLAGFALLGPVAALGLYELSRRRESGLEVSAWDALEVRNSPSIGGIVALGLTLVAIFALWLFTAEGLYRQIFAGAPPQTVSQFIDAVLTTPAGLKLIVIGNLVGLAFALVALAISVVSFPMLLDRNVSAATAVRTSIRAVIANPIVMAIWGLIVALSLLAGAGLAFVGLAVVLPVLGHATWHLYRKVVAD